MVSRHIAPCTFDPVFSSHCSAGAPASGKFVVASYITYPKRIKTQKVRPVTPLGRQVAKIHRGDYRNKMHGASPRPPVTGALCLARARARLPHLDLLHLLVTSRQFRATQSGLAYVLVDVITGAEQQLALAGA